MPHRFTTSSSVTFALPGSLFRASCAAVIAFIAPIVFRSIQEFVPDRELDHRSDPGDVPSQSQLPSSPVEESLPCVPLIAPAAIAEETPISA